MDIRRASKEVYMVVERGGVQRRGRLPGCSSTRASADDGKRSEASGGTSVRAGVASTLCCAVKMNINEDMGRSPEKGSEIIAPNNRSLTEAQRMTGSAVKHPRCWRCTIKIIKKMMIRGAVQRRGSEASTPRIQLCGFFKMGLECAHMCQKASVMGSQNDPYLQAV